MKLKISIKCFICKIKNKIKIHGLALGITWQKFHNNLGAFESTWFHWCTLVRWSTPVIDAPWRLKYKLWHSSSKSTISLSFHWQVHILDIDIEHIYVCSFLVLAKLFISNVYLLNTLSLNWVLTIWNTCLFFLIYNFNLICHSLLETNNMIHFLYLWCS